MRVLQINAINGIRSTGRIVTELTDFLNVHGHEGYIAYSEGPDYVKGFRIGTQFEKKQHAFFSRFFGKQSYYSQRGTRKLLDYIRRVNPDIIHLHNLHGNYINLKLLLEYIAMHDIPTVLTLHDCWFYTGKCTHYTVDKCFRWKNECGHCPRLKKDNRSWFFDKTSKMLADKRNWFGQIPRLAVIGVSDWITGEAIVSILLSAKIITRIHNWVDMDIFRPVPARDLKESLGLVGKFVILGVSSGWNNAKGLNKFIALSQSLPDDMKIVLVGNIHDADLPRDIIHVGETHDVLEMVKLYSIADVLLNLSPEETFGKVTAEALACGTPVIVINSTANPELIEPSCGHIIGKDFGMDELLAAMRLIQKNGKESYSMHCVTSARKRFDKASRILDYFALYEKILNYSQGSNDSIPG